MNEQERIAWIELALTPYIGAETFLRLLRHFGSAKAVFEASASDIRPLLVRKQALKSWEGREGKIAAEAALHWEAQYAHARLLLLSDSDFPAMLSEGLTPPPLLFIRGQLDYLHQPALAIVGSRHATPQAMRIASDFASALADNGNVIISGMADGIDTAAHQGALKVNGATVAIWGTGIDRVYPARNKMLATQIAEQGCIVSEFPLGTKALPNHFPRRNRLIAALSAGTLVIEAAPASGSLITARLAADMGREVMALPGSIDNPMSKGCHALIKQGATLVENLQDIYQEVTSLLQNRQPQSYKECNMGLSDGFLPSTRQHITYAQHTSLPISQETVQTEIPHTVSVNLSTEQQTVLDTMGYGIIHPDMISTMLGMAATDVYAHLMALELNGWITILPGGCYQRIKS